MTRGIGGTGLGLYICRELVRRLDGRIWVEANGGQGLEVRGRAAGRRRDPARSSPSRPRPESRRGDSNPWPTLYKSAALPAELLRRGTHCRRRVLSVLDTACPRRQARGIMEHPKDVGDRSTLAIMFALRLRATRVSCRSARTRATTSSSTTGRDCGAFNARRATHDEAQFDFPTCSTTCTTRIRKVRDATTGRDRRLRGLLP